jgi:signal transduction histidine kinase
VNSSIVSRIRERFGHEAVAFGLLRGLTLVGGMAVLGIVPLRPEHQLHLVPLLAGFVVYNAAVLVVLTRWPDEARAVFLAALAADLALVFLLVWFTGGGRSHFYLLFYLLVTINAYYFGPGIGVLAAGLASGLLVAANWLTPPADSWLHMGSHGMLLGVVGLALGHVASRERAARAKAERLNREMEAAMARLARAEQLAAVGRLSAKMAHEVRNPLGAISLNVDMLEDIIQELSGPAAGEAHEVLRGIRQEVHALADLTDEYLVAARLPRPRLEKDSINELVSELVDFLRPVAELESISITVSLGESLPIFPFDRAMLRQAVRNLIRNAMEVLANGGRIAISTGCEEHEALIAVADNGPGIAPEAADRLFEPFFTTKPGGTGLGLSIAQQIVREHGGEISCVSQPGMGARFVIRLPLRVDADV